MEPLDTYVSIHGTQIRLNINMANRDQNKVLTYWTEGTSSIQIKARKTAPVANQAFWYNGSPDGFLTGATATAKARTFAVLIGF